ncbi:MAG TPA: hypothetical protein VHB21_23390 [Minicystis sp.]|nr:hypothetical protein [Minicystis sp.]
MKLAPYGRRLDVEASVEDFGIAFAYVARLDSPAAATELLSIPSDAWQRAQRWVSVIAAAAGEGRLELGSAFAAGFSTATAEMLEVEDLSGESLERTAQPEPGAAAKPTLPFVPGAHVTPLTAASVPPSAAAPYLRPASDDALDRTMDVERARLAAEPLPFGPRPDVSVDEYATISAILEAFPDKRAIVVQRYGFHSDATFQRAEASIQAQLAGDPALRARFDAGLAAARRRVRGA